MAINTTTTLDSFGLLDPPQTQNIAGGKYPDSREKRLHGKTIRIQSSHFRFRIQNLRRHDQTGMFSFRIRPLVCKRQNQSGTKTFRIHHESGTISSSVNLVLICLRFAERTELNTALQISQETLL